MPDTKREILGVLAREERSAQHLAEALHITPAGVRQHLAALEAQGLITHRKLGGEPNRPTYLFRLSEAGKASFPKAYALLANMLLKRAKGELGAGGSEGLVQRAGAEIAAGLHLEGKSAVELARQALAAVDETLPQRCDLVPTPAGVRITVYQCPIQAVAQEHPGSCPAFFRGLLGAALRVSHVHCQEAREGVACCTLTAEA